MFTIETAGTRAPRKIRPLREIVRELSELAAHLEAATYRLLLLIGELDRRGVVGASGARSMAHWLNWRIGLSMRTAREHVRVARMLGATPLVSRAFERGEISYSKVRAISRVVTPENESYLLNIARSGTAHHLDRLVGLYRSRGGVARETEEAFERYRSRTVECRREDDGSVVIEARLPADLAAVVLRALAVAEAAAQAERRGPAEPLGTRRADALVNVAESFLAHGSAERLGGERHDVYVHVDLAALTGGEGGRCDVEGEHGIAAETARRLACDGARVAVVENRRGEVLDVGRRTRSIPTAIERALRLRDDGCRFPGCTCRHWVDAHHVHHWADGGETKLSNLILLCRQHHTLIHEGGFAVEATDHGFVFADSRGRILPRAYSPPPVGSEPAKVLRSEHAAVGLTMNDVTLVPSWGGERMDYGAALEALLWRRAHGPPERYERFKPSAPGAAA
jgi:hypothetical protein